MKKFGEKNWQHCLEIDLKLLDLEDERRGSLTGMDEGTLKTPKCRLYW
jgi:hypothetical protein